MGGNGRLGYTLLGLSEQEQKDSLHYTHFRLALPRLAVGVTRLLIKQNNEAPDQDKSLG